ncbi:PaaI family thioesterase [Psychromarinibacter sp. C21-152]|uniref:PaaI family thioesterase n=1 Tax=Psychromarinibacter sediminicola TaxID=3033385 RepID=A0AAE3NWC1_9RHOB|nr:PaaI family thioesterase [Psychromarinibacter sediminicola]MDF0602879.1 PaaI family thioesterase [Psychromarinibacter sediminicola]
MSEFGPAEAAALLRDTFAPWIEEMGLELVEGSAAGAMLRLPRSERLQLRGGPGQGVLCGQAVAAVADTSCVLALAAANVRFRNCTTVDMSVRFIRPVPDGAADVVVDIESNGRTLAVCRVSVRAEGSAKTAALATATFMYLEA